MFGQQFYFQTIRKYVSLFGTLFDDIIIERTDSAGNLTAVIKVPITYAPKEKMLARTQQDPNIDRPTATMTMPFMSFEMTDVRYDGSRKLKTITRSANVLANSPNTLQYQYNPVPYNFGFRLYILVKNAEDGTKIVEQILPYFTPDFTVTLELIPQMNELKDIPVVLNSITQEDTYTGNFTERQALIWTLDFTIKGYLYGPVMNNGVIKFVFANYYIPEVPDGQLSTAVGNTAIISQTIDQPGLTANGQPTSNAAASIPVSQIQITDDYGFVITKTDFTNDG
jgi:T4-like virus Myoviridae tail sheath stabiliser